MTKARDRKVHPHPLQGLSLCFVDSHGKGKPDWKLPPPEGEGRIVSTGGQVHPRNQGKLSLHPSRGKHRLNYCSLNAADDQSAPVGKPLAGLEVPEQNDGRAYFQPKLVEGQCRRLLKIQMPYALGSCEPTCGPAGCSNAVIMTSPNRNGILISPLVHSVAA